MRLSIKIIFVLSAIVLAQQGFAEVCWKSSYGRGVGTIPGTCKPKETKSGLLCYPDCKPGYYNVAGVCWQGCPDGFRDDGAFCRKAEYGRGAGYALWDEGKCNRDNKQGCEKNGLMWYPKCAAGYSAFGCCICRPDQTCPPGWNAVAGSCQKSSYVVGPITPNCGDKQYDAGLCYKTCSTGYNGIGPVCWGQCPPELPVDCGAMCGKSASDCVSSISQMVLSVGQVAAKIAETVATLGASAGADAAIQAAKASAIATIKATAKKIAPQVAKIGAGAIVNELKKQGLDEKMAQQLAKVTTDPETFDYMGFLKDVDPTGIAKVVDSFNKKICPTPK